MQLARLWTVKSACGKLLKGEISNVPESLQEQCRFTGVQDSWSYIDLGSLYQINIKNGAVPSYGCNWLIQISMLIQNDHPNVLSRL